MTQEIIDRQSEMEQARQENEAFVYMACQYRLVTAAVGDPELKHSDIRILKFLYEEMRAQGQVAWSSWDRIGSMLSLSETTVKHGLKKLEDRGYIIRDRKAPPWGGRAMACYFIGSIIDVHQRMIDEARELVYRRIAEQLGVVPTGQKSDPSEGLTGQISAPSGLLTGQKSNLSVPLTGQKSDRSGSKLTGQKSDPSALTGQNFDHSGPLTGQKFDRSGPDRSKTPTQVSLVCKEDLSRQTEQTKGRATSKKDEPAPTLDLQGGSAASSLRVKAHSIEADFNGSQGVYTRTAMRGDIRSIATATGLEFEDAKELVVDTFGEWQARGFSGRSGLWKQDLIRDAVKLHDDRTVASASSSTTVMREAQKLRAMPAPKLGDGSFVD